MMASDMSWNRCCCTQEGAERVGRGHAYAEQKMFRRRLEGIGTGCAGERTAGANRTTAGSRRRALEHTICCSKFCTKTVRSWVFCGTSFSSPDIVMVLLMRMWERM